MIMCKLFSDLRCYFLTQRNPSAASPGVVALHATQLLLQNVTGRNVLETQMIANWAFELQAWGWNLGPLQARKC